MPKFYLRRGSREKYADSLEGDGTFPCHRTVDYVALDTDLAEKSDDEQPVILPVEQRQHCAGALIVLKRSGHLYDNFMFRLAALSGMLDEDKLNMNAKTFSSLDDFRAGPE